MILLDTNVISEALKPQPDSRVQRWLDEQVVETLHVSSVSLAELLFGIRAMPDGRRRDALSQALETILRMFEGRVPAFDTDAARHFAILAADARAAGKGFPKPDAYIAAIASARGWRVATRDVGPFQAAGLSVIDPWALPDRP